MKLSLLSIKTARLAIGPKSMLGVFSLGRCCIIRVMTSLNLIIFYVKPQSHPGTKRTHLVPMRSLQGETSLGRFKYPWACAAQHRACQACFQATLPSLESVEAVAVNGTLLSTGGSNASLQIEGPNVSFYILVSEVLSDPRTLRHKQAS